jgi:alpha-glucosidase
MRSRSVRFFLYGLAAAALLASCARYGERSPVEVLSPDGRNAIGLSASDGVGGAAPTYRVTRSGRAIIEPSAFKILLAGKGDVAAGAKILEVKEDRVEATFEMLWGKSRTVPDRFSRALVRLQGPGGIQWDLELRAYDDGVAFRYAFPEQPNLKGIVLQAESTEFRLAGNPTLLLTSTDTLAWSHERLYRRSPLALVPDSSYIEMPMLAIWPDGTSAALTEASLRNFAGMYLERHPESPAQALRAFLSPRLDKPDAAVVGTTPLTSPWRVVWLADEAGRQIESNLLLCLNDPPQGDYSWLQTGKTTWHWWNGTAEEGLPQATPLTSFEYHRRTIDFCARHGIAFHAVVSDNRPWHQQTQVDFAPGSDTDITKPREGLDLPKIIAYAKEKGVGIRLWVHWQPLETHLEEAFSQYEAWGVKGLMVDFLDRDDQAMILHCERILECAARHKLHIQFHGSYKPSGEHRTYPNLFNREGALNLEYSKWGMKCDPQHNVDVAFTRALAGPTDYHLGGFRSIARSEFRPRIINPVVLGTRCHHLALYVVYENPMPQLCDTPEAYEGQPGLEFLEEVPVTWDETRFVAGQAGEYLVVARRSGSAWYLGGITNDTLRRLSLPLGFLGPGEYEVKLFRDGSMDDTKPNAVTIENRGATAGSPLDVDLASGGGFVAVLRPNGKKR